MDLPKLDIKVIDFNKVNIVISEEFSLLSSAHKGQIS
jgi:hypothetical protein